MTEYMRIGSFAKLFEVQPSTVRYYVKFGLLLPKIKNRQYLFNGGCRDDMKQIMEWKEMLFSLDDIHELLTLQRKFNRLLDKDIQPYLLFLNHQRNKLVKERNNIRKQLNHIDALMLRITS